MHYIYASGQYGQQEVPGRPSRETLVRAVGGTPESVWVLFRERRTEMIVNGDGHALRLPFNQDATAIYHAYAKSRGHTNPYPILGDVVLLEDN